MLAHHSRINPVRQGELRVDPDLRIFWGQKFFHEQFENEMRHLDTVERYRISVNVALPCCSMPMGDNHDLMHAAENPQ